MAKRTEKHLPNPFLLADTQGVIRDARNVVRWKPWLAMEWMDAAALRCISPIEVHAWNNAARYINKFLDNVMKMRYYDHSESWENSEPRRLQLMEEELTLEEYFAIQSLAP